MSADGRVVVVGSINVDLVCVVPRLPRAGETVAGGHFAQHGGGKSANQAVAAARLDAAVSLVGAVGGDAMGQQARDELRGEGIDVSGVRRLSAPTGVALITVDDAGENQIAVASGANAQFTLGELDLDGTGVVLLANEVSQRVVVDAARAAADAGWPVILNPAPARALPDVPLAVLTPNASEASELTGLADPEEAARELSSRTGASVLITLGAEGGLLLEPGGVPERLASMPVDVVDTTGAGDTVNGALAVELARGRPLREAASFALVAAALSTRAGGARGGMPQRRDVEDAIEHGRPPSDPCDPA